MLEVRIESDLAYLLQSFPINVNLFKNHIKIPQLGYRH